MRYTIRNICIKKSLFGFILLFGIPLPFFPLYSQQASLPKQREILFSTDSSYIKAHVRVTEKKLKSRQRGLYFWYHANKIHSNEGGFSGKLLHGKYTETNLQGKMICSGELRNGQKHGQWKYWYNSGKIQRFENWKKGIKQGRFLQTHIDRSYSVGTYRKNKMHGVVKMYNPEDKLISSEKYKHGEPVSVVPKEKQKSKNTNIKSKLGKVQKEEKQETKPPKEQALKADKKKKEKKQTEKKSKRKK